MSNPTHGGIYSIQSAVADGENVALNIRESRLVDGTTVINWPVQNTSNQNWKVKQTDGKTFKFETAMEGSSGQLLDENIPLSCVNINQPTGGVSQEWTLEPVAFIIRNSKSGRVLQISGQWQSNVVKTVANPSPDDRSVWWTFSQVNP